mgnify:CR=1 FL=1
MENIGYIFNTYLDVIITALVVITVLLACITIINSFRIKKLRKKYIELMDGANAGNLEKIILSYYDEIHSIDKKYTDVQQSIQKIEGKLTQCIQKIGVVRYNAFDDVGSNLSFAIALLDENDNGIVLNGIYSRESSVTYGKPIENGQSKYPLSAEELQALDLAKKNYNERTFLYQ